ncbi:hypothetical protein A0H81_06369 [Grifola frondosa]|uniref:Uncharacterized protein n=1 Tax=Grifola frondosa TaxID=5627 RepID=A0A1C7M9L7_GRIFR|nr:hypothetical protein A0H81_06369 [Grifola frondosa]
MMNNAFRSSESSPGSVKITYSGRHKVSQIVHQILNLLTHVSRAEETGEYYKLADFQEEEESEEEPPPSNGKSKPKSPILRIPPMKSAAKKTPPKIDVVLPGPPPKRDSAGPSLTEKTPITKGKKSAHSRGSSLASNNMESPKEYIPTSVVTGTLSSARFSPIPGRTQTPESMADDRSSIGDTPRNPRVRKTEAERMQFLQNEPLTGAVEPHRVFCTGCNKWVPLNPKLRYVMRLWVDHRKQCGKQAPPIENTQSVSPTKEIEEEEDTATSPGARKKRSSEHERQTALENDSFLGEVRPHEVYCKGCQGWIKLSGNTRFALWNWRVHRDRCPGVVRATAAERNAKLADDVMVESYTDREVVCKACRATIAFDEEDDNTLANWDEHKTSCPNRQASATFDPGPSRARVASIEAQDSSTRSNPTADIPIVKSEETTSPASLKRAREDDDEDEERLVRPRTQAYRPRDGNGPGFLDWLVSPIRNFIRGFAME